jgi:hypothetical protein
MITDQQTTSYSALLVNTLLADAGIVKAPHAD